MSRYIDADAVKVRYRGGFHDDYVVDYDSFMKAPSIEIPTWIPCSEKLPTREGHYLCSFKKPRCIDNIYVDLAYWTGGRWYGYLANAIDAWMPLPEPWKGADDETRNETV